MTMITFFAWCIFYSSCNEQQVPSLVQLASRNVNMQSSSVRAQIPEAVTDRTEIKNIPCFFTKSPVQQKNHEKKLNIWVENNGPFILIKGVDGNKKILGRIDAEKHIAMTADKISSYYYAEDKIKFIPHFYTEGFQVIRKGTLGTETRTRFSQDKAYFFLQPKEISFPRKNPTFSKTLLCEGNPYVVVMKVTSDVNQSKYSEYIVFNFAENLHYPLNREEIKQFKKAKSAQALFSIMQSSEATKLNLPNYSLFDRITLNSQIKNNYFTMKMLQKEIDSSEKSLIRHEPLSKAFPPKPNSTNNK